MSYQPEFLERTWHDYLQETGRAPDKVDPDAFVRWAYARALAHRQPRYAALARNWGVTVSAERRRNHPQRRRLRRPHRPALEARG